MLNGYFYWGLQRFSFPVRATNIYIKKLLRKILIMYKNINETKNVINILNTGLIINTKYSLK